MPVTLYSYKLKREVPMLTDDEFQPIGELLSDGVRAIKFYREQNKASLPEALVKKADFEYVDAALSLYAELTGVRIDEPGQLYAVRASDYGSPCPKCTKPFRTPKAKYCAECGYWLPDGEVAGPATL